MNKHLQLVRAFHAALSFPQAAAGTNGRLSDMDVIRYQALLMESGGDVFKAIRAGEMAEILLGLTELAYVALAAIAMQGGDVADKPVSWKQDGFVLSLMQSVSDKINQCASGAADHYAELYCLCIHLARGFVNADFDSAFRMIHEHALARLKTGGESLYSDSESIRRLKLQKAPDLSGCLYE